MSFRYPQPSNEDDFELFCLRFLRELWQCSTLQQYGKRGERQHGIDLIDESGGPPLRAVQAKHHEPDKTIPPAEIDEEVTKALESGLALDEYFILTTGRRSTQGQNAVIRVNRDHQVAGRFKVFVWTWADIEERLSQMDDATQDRVLRGDSGRSGPAVVRMLAGVLTDHFDRPVYASATVLDQELEAVKHLLDRHELEVADAKLRELESRAEDKLQPHHWYQVKALRSRICLKRWEWQRAGRELLDAKRFMPATERARVNEALGYELTGDRVRAHAIATELKAEYPHSVRPVTIWMRTAPPEVRFEDCVAAASPFVEDDEELNLALAHRALAEDRLEDALSYARRATELSAESPHAWFLLAQAKHLLGYRPSSGVQKVLLTEASECYDRAARLAHDYKMPGLEAAIRFNRAKVRHLLGSRAADVDFSAAVELARPDQDLRTEYAAYLLEMGRPEDALRELSADQAGPTTGRLFLEAAARYERNAGDDRIRASELLRRVIALEPDGRWADAHIYLVQSAIEAGTQTDARTALAGSKLRDVNPLVNRTLHGWLAASEGRLDAAKAEYREALAFLGDESPRQQVFLLAQGLAAVNDDDLALPLFLRCYRPGVFNHECRKLLGCAQRLKRHDVASRVCRELREAGESDPRIIQTEIQILQQYDPNEALRVAQEHVSRHPGDRYVALWQSTLAVRLERPELLISNLSRLPTVDQLTPEGTGLVINVLCEARQHAEALQFAYDAVRTHFDSEFAHGQFLAYFHELAEHCPGLRDGGSAAPGMAVCYHEDRDNTDRWVVLEDAADADLARGELGPDHPVRRALSGRTVGESVVLGDSAVQPRTVTIREVCHKFIYRFRDCLNQYQVRFPEGSAVQLVHVGEGDAFDVTPMIRLLEEQRKHIESLDELYRTHPFPFHAYAMLAGRDEFAAWGHLASDAKLGIRCCNGQSGEERAVLDLFRKSKTVVTDVTALITVANLDLVKVLRGSSRTFVVSQTTFDRLQNLVDRAEANRRSEGTIHLTEDGKLGHVSITPEQRAEHVAFLAGIRDAVRASCRVLPCPQAADLEPQRRDDLIKVVGRHNLDSILLAAGPESVLWTDDLVIGLIGRDFQAARVWTQAVLFVMQQEETITVQEYDRAVAKLVGWYYHDVIWNGETLVAAAELSDWQMDRWPMPPVARCLGNDTAAGVERVAMAAAAIRAAWRHDVLTDAKRAFLFAVLGGLGSLDLVRLLKRIVPRLFSVDVFSADEVDDCIGVWLRHPPRKLIRP